MCCVPSSLRPNQRCFLLNKSKEEICSFTSLTYNVDFCAQNMWASIKFGTWNIPEHPRIIKIINFHTSLRIFPSIESGDSSYDRENWRKLICNLLVLQLWHSGSLAMNNAPSNPQQQQLQTFLRLNRIPRNLQFQLMNSFAVKKKNESVIHFRSGVSINYFKCSSHVLR